MYKVFVHSHLGYCDIIYHIPSRHTQLGIDLKCPNGKKLKEFNTKQLLLLPVHGEVHVAQSSMKNCTGNHYLVVDGVGAFCKYIRL